MNTSIYWLTQNLADVPESDEWLSEPERNTLAGLRFAKRRNDWRLGRWTARQAIRNYLSQSNCNLSSFEIRAAADGAPEVFRSGVPADFVISISHAADRGLCAIAARNCALGCDLEPLEPREDSLISDYFTPEEIALCRQAASENRILMVNLIWSAKESMLKCLREGLRRDTRSVAVHPDTGELQHGWNLWTGLCLESGRAFHGWWRVQDGFVYTVSSDRQSVISDK